MTLKKNAKSKEKLTCGFKFHPTTQKSEKFHFDGLFLSKVYKVWAKKKSEKLSFMTLKQWCKIWINAGLVVSKMAWGIG